MRNIWIPMILLIFSEGISAYGLEVDCDINSGPCKKGTDKGIVIFDVSPKPVKAMNELEFIVHLDGFHNYDYDLLKISLSMPGMYMGKNEVILKRLEKGRYKGKGVIPMCVTGKTLWKATIDLQDFKVDFLFDVTH
ncbi:MAG: hypothetical protein Fur0020_13010 [Thermodesulfovibrionia bacterium]